MTVRFDFKWIEESHKIIDDEFQVTVTIGKKGDIQIRRHKPLEGGIT